MLHFPHLLEMEMHALHANCSKLTACHPQAAAQLYEMAGEGEMAAALYLKAGLVDQASAIMAQQQHKELQLPFAQALEGVSPSASPTPLMLFKDIMCLQIFMQIQAFCIS